MAQGRSLKAGRLKLMIGDGETPEAFSSPCGFMDTSFEVTTDLSDNIVPDCDDGDKVVPIIRHANTTSWSISGSGKLIITGLQSWREWATSGEKKNVRVEFDDTGANGGGYYSGEAFLTSFSVSATRSEVAEISVDIAGSGALVWTEAA